MNAESGWEELELLLNAQEGDHGAIEETFPESRRWAFLAALDRLDSPRSQQVRTAGRRLSSAKRLAACPILAVAGKLNAGKTSLVASFLSPAGRKRALRGEANHQGTHRFALWLPQRWRDDPELFGAIRARIGEALGAPPEDLSDSPEEAHHQYNNRSGVADGLSIPLLATDPGLDALGLGFLDCPDTDTSETLALGSPEQRMALLRRAAPLCSGFLVVAAHHALRDARLEHVLKTLCEAMPNVERMLAINMVRPRYAPHEVLADMADMVQRHGIRQVYLAYDYEIPESLRYRSPRSSENDERFPEFFRPDLNPARNDAAAMPEDRWLRTLPSRLDPSELFRQLAVDLRHDVGRATLEGIAGLEEIGRNRARDAQSQRERFLDAVLQFCVAKWTAEGRISELRLLQNPVIAKQLITAFTHAAPWYARVQLRLQHLLQANLQKAWDSVASVRAWMTSVPQIKENISSGLRAGKTGRLLDANSLADVLVQLGSGEPLGISAEQLRQRCEQVVDRLEHETSVLLDQAALESAAAEVWRNIPAGKKLLSGVTALGGAVAAFGAVLLIPIDGGGTAILAAASVKELLGAAGLSTAAAWWSGQQFQRAVSGATAVQQVSDFVAALEDAFGIPREGPGLSPLQLKLSTGNQVLPPPSMKPRVESVEPLSQFHLRAAFMKGVEHWTGRSARGWFR